MVLYGERMKIKIHSGCGTGPMLSVNRPPNGKLVTRKMVFGASLFLTLMACVHILRTKDEYMLGVNNQMMENVSGVLMDINGV
jgi:hypothetical protein